MIAMVACSDGGVEGSVDAAGSGSDAATGNMIGPAGGTVTADGAVLTIPAGALSVSTMITLTKTVRVAPSGAFGASPVYEMQPSGQTFAVPVSLAITFPGAILGLRMLWSKAGVATPTALTDFDILTPTVVGTTVTATNTHFSACLAASCECQ